MNSPSRIRTVLAALGLAVLSLVGVAAPASAHDQLVSSDPADGAVLTALPQALTLTYNAELLPTGAQIAVTNAAGSAIDTDVPQVTGTTVTAPLPADLPGGAYEVAWRVVSSDGHPIEGNFVFTLDVADTATPTPSATTTTPETGATDGPFATPETDAAGDVVTAEADRTAGSSAVWWVVGATAVAALAVTVVVLTMRRRAGTDS